MRRRALGVAGFRFGAAACSVKSEGRPDCGLIVAERPAAAAAAFTRNRFRAAPVEIAARRLRAGRLQALVVNSGNANACTGAAGYRAAERVCERAARLLGVAPALVAPASTGIIGVPLPWRRIERGLPRAVRDLAPGGVWDFAEAIRTTDAFPKVAACALGGRSGRATVVGVAKGAGMIAPDMATLLVFLLTDASLDRDTLRRARALAAAEFNSLSVDGDTSTNDSLFLLASGASGWAPVGARSRRALLDAVAAVARELASQVASDGEGATKLVRVEVSGARTEADARRAARAVGESLLVKTAVFGEDPNWGRIACALGYSGARFDPERVRIWVAGVLLFRRGAGVGGGRARARRAMRGREVELRIDLGAGQASARLVTSDLSHAYVELNSAYST